MKKMLLSTAAFLLGITLGYAQQSFTLEECRQMAIANSKEALIADQKVSKAQHEKRAALSQYLPSFSATGTYMFNSRDINLLSQDALLPVGTKMADGSFGFTPDQIGNSWANIPGVGNVPLDANGQPFDPKTNPELIQWKNYAYMPQDAFSFDTKNVFAGAVSVLQPVFMGGKIIAYNKITKYAEELARSQKDTQLQDVIIRTDQAYWQIVSLVNKKELAESYLKTLEELSRNVDHMVEEGVATRADALSVEVRLNQAQITLAQVEDGLSLSKMLLCQLCGLPVDTSFVLADQDIDRILREKISTDRIDIARAVDNRQEIRSLTLAADIYKNKERIIRSEGLPNIALAGNYLVSNPNVFNGFQNKFNGMWNVGVVVKIPIFHFGEISHKIKAAKAETEIARLEKENAQQKIELQINQSIFKVNEAEKTLRMASNNLSKADENLRSARIGFEEGVMPLTQVFEAQTAWLSAHSSRIDAEIDSRMADVYLKKAIGQLEVPALPEENTK